MTLLLLVAEGFTNHSQICKHFIENNNTHIFQLCVCGAVCLLLEAEAQLRWSTAAAHKQLWDMTKHHHVRIALEVKGMICVMNHTMFLDFNICCCSSPEQALLPETYVV